MAKDAAIGVWEAGFVPCAVDYHRGRGGARRVSEHRPLDRRWRPYAAEGQLWRAEPRPGYGRCRANSRRESIWLGEPE
jgi:hypothetical protein